MKSEKRLVCPVTGQRAKPVPYSEEEEGAFVVLDEEDEGEELIDHPLGWGALTLRVVIPNPYLAETRAIRAAATEEAMGQLRKLAEDTSIDSTHRALLRENLDSGAALREVEANLDEKHPLPDREVVTARLSYPVLGNEAIGALVQKLREAGFRIALPGETEK